MFVLSNGVAKRLLFGSALFGLTACGSAPKLSDSLRSDSGSTSNQGQAADATSLRHIATVPPAEYYNLLMDHTFSEITQGAPGTTSNLSNGLNAKASAQQAPLLWLNFAGATVERGFKPDQTFLSCAATIDIPAAKLSAEEKSIVLKRVQGLFSATGVKLNVIAQNLSADPTLRSTSWSLPQFRLRGQSS